MTHTLGRRFAILLLTLLLLTAAALGLISQNLTRIVRWTVQRALPQVQVHIGEVKFAALTRLAVREFLLRDRQTGAELLRLDASHLQATPMGLLKNGEITSLDVRGGNLLLGTTLQQLLSPASDNPSNVTATWNIGQLDIQGIRVRLEDTRETASDISFLLHTTLRNISPAGVAAALSEEPQFVEIADLKILSPYDPFITVLALHQISLRFTLSGLLRRELDQILIHGPSISIGQDLFWYMEDTEKRLQGGITTGPSWKIKSLEVQSGQLLVGSGGRAKYGVPLNFHAIASDIALDNLAALKLQTVFQIPGQEYAFPNYQLEISTKEGDLQFAYPPEKHANNLVGKVFLHTIRWRQFQASDSWLSATFDRTGINGDFGGHVYGGYMSGGFSFLFEDGAPWIGWLSGEKISMNALTDIIAPKNFRMTGPVGFKLQMDAFGSHIERVKGNFRVRKPGRMIIGKLNDLLANVPNSWSNLKKSSTRIALEALRDFDYKQAHGEFWFVHGQGIFGLQLQGPLGSRNLNVVLHAQESDSGRWNNKP